MQTSTCDKSAIGAGFTLIELSIVLVIIGLIVGGVLVGQDLIRAATVRAQITQIEKYNTAVNTFYGKYQALPGDLNQSVAATYGFASRGTTPGEGDGNGLIDGSDGSNAQGSLYPATGEQGMFWVDLSSKAAGNLIDGGFTTATPTTTYYDLSPPQIGLYFPSAKLGQGNFISVYELGGLNYYQLLIPQPSPNNWYQSGNIPVNTAYQIDKKIDDGLPQTGNVITLIVEGSGLGYFVAAGTYNTTLTPSANTCFDGSAGAYEYTLSINGGNGGNCSLSFKFQ
jgi:prepilin-type N-terminal cleavage/methylation domain-containing protein